MNITLEHITPYLPYGLKMKTKSFSSKNPDIMELTYENIQMMIALERKPILHPISDLKKEIEFNGEKFIPREKLFDCFENVVFSEFVNDNGTIDTFTATYTILESPFTDYIVYCGDIDSVRYRIVIQLIEWHFDIFNLIENGLAININTLQCDK